MNSSLNPSPILFSVFVGIFVFYCQFGEVSGGRGDNCVIKPLCLEVWYQFSDAFFFHIEIALQVISTVV